MADVIYRNGLISTQNPGRPTVQSIALRAGRIMALGTNEEVNGLQRRDTRVIDLAGAVILPGFHDSHVHLTGYGLALSRPDLSNASSLAAGLEQLRRAGEGTGWLIGAGVPVSRWGPENLTASVLDRLWPDRPVLLKSQDRHSAWLNSRALELAGITASTPDPQGGRISRDADGNPSGLLFEAATDLAEAHVPEPDAATLRSALADAATALARMGVTTVHHMAAEPASYWRALADAASRSDYALRVWACLPQEEIEAAAAIGIATGQGGSNFQVGGAKFFTDGALGSGTAWFSEPYEGSSETGVAMLDPEVFRERVALAVRSRLVPVVHAIGDAAVHDTIDALEACAPEWQALGMRPRIEHAQHISREDVLRMARLGIIASVQPIHLTFDALHAERLLGRARLAQMYVFRQFLDSGVSLAFGSDTPVAPPGVLKGLVAATTRLAQDGSVFGADEAVTVPEAIYAYTRAAARAIGREHRSGKLDVGYDADLVVLSQHPQDGLEQTTVLQTVKSGRVTHDARVLKGRET